MMCFTYTSHYKRSKRHHPRLSRFIKVSVAGVGHGVIGFEGILGSDSRVWIVEEHSGRRDEHAAWWEQTLLKPVRRPPRLYSHRMLIGGRALRLT